MMKDFSRGEKVMFIDGDQKGQFGTYLHHERDSGYLVPFVLMKDDIIRKPWDREIVSMSGLMELKTSYENRLENINEMIKLWDSNDV